MTEDFTQARIRVNRDGALILRDALEHYESILIDERRGVVGEARQRVWQELRHVRRVLDETERTIAERGWSDGEPELAQQG